MSELAQHKLAVWKYIYRELSTVQQALARNAHSGGDGQFAARLRRQLDQLQQASDAALQELEDTLHANRPHRASDRELRTDRPARDYAAPAAPAHAHR